MTAMPRLSKSGVEYLDYSWGIWSGCLNLQRGSCPVKACWAKGIANHYPTLYPDGFEPHFYPEAIDSPKHLKKPSIISVGWVGDVIGYGLEYRGQIFETIRHCPQHRFLFLTKNPERLSAWGNFPDNCEVGVTVCNYTMANQARYHLGLIKARVKYLSIEPLLEPLVDRVGSQFEFWGSSINGVIIGAQTKPSVYPKVAWVKEIVAAADRAGIKVFLKNNLTKLIPFSETNAFLFQPIPGVPTGRKLRQELVDA